MQYVLPILLILACIGSAYTNKKISIFLVLLSFALISFSFYYSHPQIEYVAKNYNVNMAMQIYSCQDRMYHFGIFVGEGSLSALLNLSIIKKPKKYALIFSAFIAIIMALLLPVHNWHSGSGSYHGHKL